MATMTELMKAWVANGAWVHLKDGRTMPMKELWREIYDKNPDEWKEVFKDAPDRSK